MTEIQWLCDVLLNFKLPGPVKDKFIARIGEVESKLSPTNYVRPVVSPTQAPSTQRLLEDPLPVIRAPTPPAPIDKETGRAMVSTGNGTKGPRKF